LKNGKEPIRVIFFFILDQFAILRVNVRAELNVTHRTYPLVVTDIVNAFENGSQKNVRDTVCCKQHLLKRSDMHRMMGSIKNQI